MRASVAWEVKAATKEEEEAKSTMRVLTPSGATYFDSARRRAVTRNSFSEESRASMRCLPTFPPGYRGACKLEGRINDAFCNDRKLVWNMISYPDNSDALDLHLWVFEGKMVVVVVREKRRRNACESLNLLPMFCGSEQSSRRE
jgi:hypothetical protein